MATASERRAAMSRGGASSPSRFQYHRRNATDLKEKEKSYAQGGRDNFIEAEITTFSPSKGDNWVRILPPSWDDAKHYGLEVYVHYGIGPDHLAYLCLEKNKGQPCPICQERAALSKIGQDDAAAELKPAYRVAVYMIDRKEPDKGVQLWLMPYTIDQELVTLSQDKHSGEVLWIDDPDNGYDVEFVRAGEKLQTKYQGIRIVRNPTPLDKPEALDFIMDHPLPSVFIYASAEAMEKALAGHTQPGSEGPSKQAASNSPSGESAAPTARPIARRGVGPRSTYTPEQILEAALKAADAHNIDIPNELSDPEVGPHVAAQLGDKVSEYPELAGLKA